MCWIKTFLTLLSSPLLTSLQTPQIRNQDQLITMSYFLKGRKSWHIYTSSFLCVFLFVSPFSECSARPYYMVSWANKEKPIVSLSVSGTYQSMWCLVFLCSLVIWNKKKWLVHAHFNYSISSFTRVSKVVISFLAEENYLWTPSNGIKNWLIRMSRKSLW